MHEKFHDNNCHWKLIISETFICISKRYILQLKHCSCLFDNLAKSLLSSLLWGLGAGSVEESSDCSHWLRWCCYSYTPNTDNDVAIATSQWAGVILGPHSRNTSLTHQPLHLALLSDVTIVDKDPVYSLQCWHQRYDNKTETQNRETCHLYCIFCSFSQDILFLHRRVWIQKGGIRAFRPPPRFVFTA